MCGGVIFPFKEIYRVALEEIYSAEQVDEFEKSGQVRALYWQRGEPVLPVVELGPEGAPLPETETVMRWGNRDRDKPLPQTGWARVESLEQGKWSHLRPQPVLIPVTHGVEKGKWFIIEHGIRGVVVRRGGEKRVYMLTDQSGPDFLAITHHERMPVLVGQDRFPWVPEPGGTHSANP